MQNAEHAMGRSRGEGLISLRGYHGCGDSRRVVGCGAAADNPDKGLRHHAFDRATAEGKSMNLPYLSRVNFLREEPGKR